MKWLSSRFAYPLIILTLVLSVALQLVWLHQLFSSQKAQLKVYIEQSVGQAAKLNIYKSIAANRPVTGSMVKKFFLSPQWLEMRMAFDELKMDGVHSIFNYGIDEDSTLVEMSFSFRNEIVRGNQIHLKRKELKSQPAKAVRFADSISLAAMVKEVKNRLQAIGVKGASFYAIYRYGNEELDSVYIPTKYLGKIEFSSRIYSYNLRHLYKYQLLLPDLNTAVFYSMRYYIASSVLMLLLTIVVFYFIIQLLKRQKIYADAKISFTSNMTHEFKTPIATVSVALESISRFNLIHEPEKMNRYLEISKTELKRLNIMIEKVLNLENELGTELNLEPYDVQEGLEQIIETMKPAIEKRHMHISFFRNDIKVLINADPLHLENVFYNLIDNAIKYAGKGTELTIICLQDKGKLNVCIKDNGKGIAGIYQAKVFDRFFRVPTPKDTHEVKGSGLGLHYVKTIIVAHKGQITLESLPGTGCTFTISLPIYEL